MDAPFLAEVTELFSTPLPFCQSIRKPRPSGRVVVSGCSLHVSVDDTDHLTLVRAYIARRFSVLALAAGSGSALARQVCAVVCLDLASPDHERPVLELSKQCACQMSVLSLDRELVLPTANRDVHRPTVQSIAEASDRQLASHVDQASHPHTLDHMGEVRHLVQAGWGRNVHPALVRHEQDAALRAIRHGERCGVKEPALLAVDGDELELVSVDVALHGHLQVVVDCRKPTFQPTFFKDFCQESSKKKGPTPWNRSSSLSSRAGAPGAPRGPGSAGRCSVPCATAWPTATAGCGTRVR